MAVPPSSAALRLLSCWSLAWALAAPSAPALAASAAAPAPGSSPAAQSAAAGGAWRKRAPMPTARSGAAGAVLGGKFCVAGGYYKGPNGPVLVAAHECYDPKTDAWSKRAPLPSPRSGAFAVVLDEQMYVLGGIDQGQVTSELNQRYDPKTDRWETLPPLPTSRVVPVAAVVGKQIFVIGGEREAPDFEQPYLRPARANEVFDPAAKSWRKAAPMPTARPRPAVAVQSGRILVFGGGQVYGPPVERTAESYDPAQDVWSEVAPMPTARTAAFAALLDGRVHVFGGYVDDATAKPEPFRFLTANEAWDPATNRWSAFAPLPVARGGFAGAVLDGKVYLVGGYNPSLGMLSNNDEYSPPRAK